MKYSLYFKFVWFTLVTMFISAVISFLVVNTYYHQFVKVKNDTKNTTIALEIANYLQANQLRPEASLQLLGSAGYQIYFVNSAGRGTFYGGDYRDTTLSPAVIDQVLAGDIYHGMRDFPRETFVTGFFANELRNTVGVPVLIEGEPHALFLRPNIRLLFGELHFLFGGLALCLLILSVAGMLWVAKKLIEPIAQLTKATQEMTMETFDHPIEIYRRDELGQLVDSFNKMRKQLKQITEKRKEFVNNVSHDIQSPLHNIQSYLTLLEDPDVTATEQAHYREIIHREVQRLSSLTKQLLALTGLDKRNHVQERKLLSVNDQWKEMIQRNRWKLEEKEISISYSLKGSEIKGNPILLQTVWENLLSNALKYSEPGGAIHIDVRDLKDGLRVIVQDEGIGMSSEEAAQAFERFYRAEKARNRNTEGSGLGLSIVQEIIALHQGTVDIISQPQQGTTVQVLLPKY